MMAFIMLRNQATNLVIVKPLNIAIDFCFPKVTEEGLFIQNLFKWFEYKSLLAKGLAEF